MGRKTGLAEPWIVAEVELDVTAKSVVVGIHESLGDFHAWG